MMRVSPPEEDRELPGPQASIRVTFAPRRRRYKAVHPPNAPAPITATGEFVCMWDVTRIMSCGGSFFPLDIFLAGPNIAVSNPGRGGRIRLRGIQCDRERLWFRRPGVSFQT